MIRFVASLNQDTVLGHSWHAITHPDIPESQSESKLVGLLARLRQHFVFSLHFLWGLPHHRYILLSFFHYNQDFNLIGSFFFFSFMTQNVII